MSELIPPEREGLYRELGLEELLVEEELTSGSHIINDKRDSFGNDVQLVWDAETGAVHMRAADFDVEVPGEQATESLKYHIPVFAGQLGWTALEGVLFEGRQAA